MKTTRQHFRVFQKETLKWLELFGLEHWGVTFSHEELSAAYADFTASSINKVAHVRLNMTWSGARPLSEEEVKKTAKHEAIHVLLCNLEAVGRSRYVTEDEFTNAIEDLVRKLAVLLE